MAHVVEEPEALPAVDILARVLPSVGIGFFQVGGDLIECGPNVAQPLQQRIRPGERLDIRNRGGKARGR